MRAVLGMEMAADLIRHPVFRESVGGEIDDIRDVAPAALLPSHPCMDAMP